MGATTKTLYETDFVEWVEETAKLLRERRFDELDLENLIEEVDDLGTSQRWAVQSQLQRMLKHLIKQRIQPERAGSSWHNSIFDAQSKLSSKLETAPSLKRFLRSILENEYRRAVKYALKETTLPQSRAAELPEKCPWTLDELLEGDPE